VHTGNPLIDDSTAPVVVASDECGYGCWAGPLYVTAVAVPSKWSDPRVKDSKKLSEKQREALHDEFHLKVVNAIHIVQPEEIYRVGVYKALIDAHGKALLMVLKRVTKPSLVIMDGTLPAPQGVPQAISLPKADSLVPACALASIIGKVERDRIMVELAKTYPGYGFARHKGYGTAEHMEALGRLGPCEIHRKSYAPVAKALQAREHRAFFDFFDETEKPGPV
jgi:ribonuclease HII